MVFLSHNNKQPTELNLMKYWHVVEFDLMYQYNISKFNQILYGS